MKLTQDQANLIDSFREAAHQFPALLCLYEAVKDNIQTLESGKSIAFLPATKDHVDAFKAASFASVFVRADFELDSSYIEL